jgi:hypothetical protein
MFLGVLKCLFGPKMLADPYPFYARLRSATPVSWVDQLGGWVLTRYADVTAVLRSPHTSSDRWPRVAALSLIRGPHAAQPSAVGAAWRCLHSGCLLLASSRTRVELRAVRNTAVDVTPYSRSARTLREVPCNPLILAAREHHRQGTRGELC